MALRINHPDLRTQTPSSSDIPPTVPHGNSDDTGRLGLALVVFGIVALVGAVAALAVMH